MASAKTCDGYASQIDTTMTQVAMHSARKNITNVCGECGPCWGGGTFNVTDAFASSFWYLTGLAYGARQGFKKFCRSSLIGGAYEVIDYGNKTRPTRPNPDFWAAFLWARFCGPKAVLVNEGMPHTGDVRVYAQCGQEEAQEIVLLVLNMGSDEASVALPSGTIITRVWEVRAVGGNLSSRVACMVQADGSCAPLTKIEHVKGRDAGSGSMCTVGPQSYAFVSTKGGAKNICS